MLLFEYRFAEDKNERLSGLAADLARTSVDVILTHGSPATRAAKQATSMIPIVMDSGEVLDHRTYIFAPGRGLAAQSRR